MTDLISNRSRFLPCAALWAAAGLVAAFYWWTVASTNAVLRPVPEHHDYYNQLARGFARGHTYMEADVDPRLLALPAAERPGNAPFLLDASLYRDRYYLYFGVVPVLLVELPFTLLTGYELPQATVAAIFALGILASGLAWWRIIRRRWLAGSSPYWDILVILALGFCTAAPSALRRPMFYEVAIASGCAFSLLALCAATRACLSPRRVEVWLGLAGLAVGLAVGSRANLVPAGILMLVLAAMIAPLRSPGFRARLRLLRAPALGAAAVGAGLMAYNVARFGNPLEFGHSYQFGSNPKQFFHFANLRHNLELYYGAPPALNGYFPFVAPGDEAPKPDDYIGREHAHGEWIWLAVVAVGLAATLQAVWRRRRTDGGIPAWVFALPAMLFAVNLLVTAASGVRANRYMLDFHPALVLLTLGLLAPVFVRGGAGPVLRLAAAGAIAAAALFNVLASFQVHGFLRLTDPAGFQRLAAVADGVAGSLGAGGISDREATVQWPEAGGALPREPLFAAGSNDFEDTIWLDFNGAGLARLVYQHGESGDTAGDWFAYPAGGKSRVRISGALLLPPVHHPLYGARPEVERLALKRHLRVLVEGVERLSRDVPSYDSSPRLQHWGHWHRADGAPAALRIEPAPGNPDLDTSWLPDLLAGQGVFRLKLVLPRDRYGSTEPLLQGGVPGRIDTLGVRYTGPGRIQLVHDQFSSGERESEEIAVDYLRPQEVEIETPVATDGIVWGQPDPLGSRQAPDRLRVWWNGREVFAPAVPPTATSRGAISVGLNNWNSSAARPLFSGLLDIADAPVPIGDVGAAGLEARLPRLPWTRFSRGVLVAFQRPDSERASLVWRHPASGKLQMGWLEAGETTWSREIDEVSFRPAMLRLGLPAATGGETRPWLELEEDGRSLITRKTDFFSQEPVAVSAVLPQSWTGAIRRGASVGPPAPEMPGRVRLRFILPKAETGADPLVTAGKIGAADLLYVRSLGGGRYVFGIDHWGIGVTESSPLALEPGALHTVVIEMSSLFPAGTAPRAGARIWCDGALAFETALPLYPATPNEVIFGRRPTEMSTGSERFRGDLISVRTRQTE